MKIASKIYADFVTFSTTDRSFSPAPPERGRSTNTANLKRRFHGVIAIDGVEYNIHGDGNGPISSLANALHTLNIDLDVATYKEHAIGKGSDVKAASYIECIVGGTGGEEEERIWGVGINQDTAQASLVALLSAASSVSVSRDENSCHLQDVH